MWDISFTSPSWPLTFICLSLSYSLLLPILFSWLSPKGQRIHRERSQHLYQVTQIAGRFQTNVSASYFVDWHKSSSSFSPLPPPTAFSLCLSLRYLSPAPPLTFPLQSLTLSPLPCLPVSLCKSVCRLSSQLLYLLSCKVKRKSGFYFCAVIEEVVSSYLNNLDKINHTSIVNIAQRIRLWRSGRGSRWPLIKNAPERWIRRLLTCISKTKGGGEGLSMQNSYYSGNIKNSLHSLSENMFASLWDLLSNIFWNFKKSKTCIQKYI